MAKLGHGVAFISMRFSLLSKWKGDSRLILSDRANRLEMFEGIKCYLWRTAFHPFASNNPLLKLTMAMLFPLYARLPNKTVDGLLAAADYVIIESSVAAIFIRRIRKVAPSAHIIYYATDRLDTVGAHPFVRRQLEVDGPLIGHVSMRSPRMADDFSWASGRLFRAEFGIEESEFADIGANPYTGGLNAVSLGSMLFDPRFFESVAPAFPHVTFHVIGCGIRFTPPPNVIVYDEMKFKDTLPYLKYATIGIAPYHDAPGTEYLADSSLKLAQFEYFRLPAVCPDFATGSNPSRFGYRTGDAASMCNALEAALAKVGQVAPRKFQSWEDVAARVLAPKEFSDTAI